jgi:hypothetical protein
MKQGGALLLDPASERSAPGHAIAQISLALTLPLSIVIMAVLVALLLAYHLTAARWATRQPER